MNALRSHFGNERGAVLVLVAASMVVMLGFAALAIDVGNLMMVRTESQKAADAAALAGAGWLIPAPDDSAGARSRAIDFAARNNIQRIPAVVLPEDVEVNLDSSLVRVHVYNTADRGNAVPTFFAKILGIGAVNVSTVAAAWAAPADALPPSNADCPLPIALPDKWIDSDGDRHWDPGETYNPEGTGFSDDDLGKLIVLKVSGSQDNGPPSCREAAESPLVDLDLCRELPDSDNWRCWYQPEENSGGGTDVLGPQIYPGDACGDGLAIGDPVWAASGSGNKQSLVETVHEDFGGRTECRTVCETIPNPDGTTTEVCSDVCSQSYGSGSFADLIRSDPDLVWTDPDGEFGPEVGCVVRTSSPTTADGSPNCVEDSPRIRSVPIVRPDAVTATGSGVTTTVIDFTGVFVERVSCNYGLGDFGGPEGNWNVYVRLVRAPGSSSGGGGGGSSPGPTPGGTTLKQLRLIQ
ncbi:MAG: pilus assembly protein TadG-related protein [Gemmatimonadota bacterium]